MKRHGLITLISFSAALLAACSGESGDPTLSQYGPNPDLPEPRRNVMPDMVIAKPAEWGERVPTVPEG